jgi:hypothetical protein
MPYLPASRGDPVACAKNNSILCFDNLSTISPYSADDLCRLTLKPDPSAFAQSGADVTPNASPLCPTIRITLARSSARLLAWL